MIFHNIANVINNFIVGLYDKGFHFYQILIGMFVFDFIIYQICKMLKEMRVNVR